MSLNLNQYQYIFVGGILGEILALPFIGNYFKENIKSLKEDKVEHAFAIFPNSIKSAHQNAPKLRKKIKELYLKNNKKIVLVTHSKGSIETLLALMDDPFLFEESVAKILCVQPPFSGTTLLDLKSKSLSKNLVLGTVNKMTHIWPGLACLKKNYYTDLFLTKTDLHPVIKKLLEEKVVTIKGCKDKDAGICTILRFSHEIFRENGLHNDGLVSYADQKIPGVKIKEILFPMDHSDLFVTKRFSPESKRIREELFVKLLNLIFENKVKDEPKNILRILKQESYFGHAIH